MKANERKVSMTDPLWSHFRRSFRLSLARDLRELAETGVATDVLRW